MTVGSELGMISVWFRESAGAGLARRGPAFSRFGSLDTSLVV